MVLFQVREECSMSTVTNNLKKIEFIKEQIHSAIKNKGVNIANDIPFEEYPNEIGKITGGGVALDSTTLVVRNLSGKDLKVGDSCWLNYYCNIQNSKNSFPRLNGSLIIGILSADGNFVYFPNKDGIAAYSKLNGIELNNSVIPSPWNDAGSVFHYGPNGEILTKNSISNGNVSRLATDYRSDTRYVNFGTSNYVGEDIFVDYYNNTSCVYKRNLDTGEILHTWTLKKVDGGKDDEFDNRNWERINLLASNINGKTILFNFHKEREKYFILDESLPDNSEIEGIPISIDLSSGIIPWFITEDKNFLVSLQPFKFFKIESLNTFTEVYPTNIVQLEGLLNTYLQLDKIFYNNFSQTFSILTNTDCYIFQYVGSDGGRPLLNKVFIPDLQPVKSGSRRLTLSADMKKACQYSDNSPYHYYMYSLQDQASFIAVPDNSCSSVSLQGIVTKVIPDTDLIEVSVFKLEEKDIEINVPADTEIEIIGGLE